MNRLKLALLIGLAVVLYTTALVFTASRAGASTTDDTVRAREIRSLTIGETYAEVTAELGVYGQPLLHDHSRVLIRYQRVLNDRYANLVFRFAYGELTLTHRYLCSPLRGCHEA